MAYTTDWARPSCSCPYFRRTAEICKHIRAAQAAQAECQQARRRARFSGTDAEYFAHVQAEIDAIFAER